jgi:hypothetical protein
LFHALKHVAKQQHVTAAIEGRKGLIAPGSHELRNALVMYSSIWRCSSRWYGRSDFRRTRDSVDIVLQNACLILAVIEKLKESVLDGSNKFMDQADSILSTVGVNEWIAQRKTHWLSITTVA